MSGFKSIAVKFGEKFSVPHQIFFKQHKTREESDDRPSDLTLFVCNIPPYYDEKCLKYIFKSCGIVKSVYFSSIDSPTEIIRMPKSSVFNKPVEIEGYKIAHVVFTSALDLQNALSWNPSEPVTFLPDEFSLITGLRKYAQEYNSSFPSPDEMDREIKDFMKNYDEKVNIKEIVRKKNAEPDVEGWVQVSKRGRNPGFARKQSVKDNLMRKVQRRKQKKTLLNFYTFQIKESKMNHLSKLREKFEEDKKKIESLKSKRKFKPF